MITVISAYHFAPIAAPADLRGELYSLCKELDLRGLILVAPEGLNVAVAGLADAIATLMQGLQSIAGFATLTPKYSECARQPYRRLLVKLKKEIIAFGVPDVAPASATSARLSANELCQWLDEGRDINLIDTRNDYEARLGTFAGALPIGIRHFRDFPEAAAKLAPEMKLKPTVIFCTGGVRCEKAGPILEKLGFGPVYQLDGGIIRYFEEVGGKHYDGSCFVFDHRVAIDPSLQPSGERLCYCCQEPLTAGEQADARYVVGLSCPYCYRDSAAQEAALLSARQVSLAKLCQPLPGSVAYDNYRPVRVGAAFAGLSLVDFLCRRIAGKERAYWEAELSAGKFLNETKQPVCATTVVRDGERYFHLMPGTIEPNVSTSIKILYEDAALIIVDKPAPLPTHPSGRYNRNSLQYLLSKLYFPILPRPAHRLDANTAGVMIWTKSKEVASKMQEQFASGRVEKVYSARVQGQPAWTSQTIDMPISDLPTTAGAHLPDPSGRPAQTKLEVRARLDDGTTLLAVRPQTGRTNQIRAHLWHLGLPIVGDPSYLPGGKLGDTQTLGEDESSLELSSEELVFAHPQSGAPVRVSRAGLQLL